MWLSNLIQHVWPSIVGCREEKLQQIKDKWSVLSRVGSNREFLTSLQFVAMSITLLAIRLMMPMHICKLYSYTCNNTYWMNTTYANNVVYYLFVGDLYQCSQQLGASKLPCVLMIKAGNFFLWKMLRESHENRSTWILPCIYYFTKPWILTYLKSCSTVFKFWRLKYLHFLLGWTPLLAQFWKK